MGVTSIRLNEKEEKLLNFLKEYYECDTSVLLKKSLWEMYEDIKDKEIIEDFEAREQGKETSFSSSKDITK